MFFNDFQNLESTYTCNVLPEYQGKVDQNVKRRLVIDRMIDVQKSIDSCTFECDRVTGLMRESVCALGLM